MKPVLLGVPCICTSLSLPSFAQGSPSHRQNDLTQALSLTPWKGDLDGMVKHPVIRALVASAGTSHWLIGARQVDAEYERSKAFDQEVNQHHKTQGQQIRMWVLNHVESIAGQRIGSEMVPHLSNNYKYDLVDRMVGEQGTSARAHGAKHCRTRTITVTHKDCVQ